MDISIFSNIQIFFKHVGITLVVGYYLLAILAFFGCLLLTLFAFIEMCTGITFIPDQCPGNCSCYLEQPQIVQAIQQPTHNKINHTRYNKYINNGLLLITAFMFAYIIINNIKIYIMYPINIPFPVHFTGHTMYNVYNVSNYHFLFI